MRVESKRFAELSSDELLTWQRLRMEGVGLDGAFFDPDFLRLASAAYPNIEVAVLRDHDAPVGFWPFERRGTKGLPVAADVCETSGVIASDHLHWNPTEVLRSLGLSQWSYDCVAAIPRTLERFHVCHRSFPRVQLQNGFDDYCRQLTDGGSRQIAETKRKKRKLEREQGAIRFEWNDVRPEMLDQLLTLKRKQYRLTGAKDVLGIPRVQNLLRRAHGFKSAEFQSVLSVLRVGDRPVAFHFGLVSGNVLAWWFPTYDPEFSAYSPGNLLLLAVMETAAACGITRIDLGQGDERYKLSFANDQIAVAEGVLSQSPWARIWKTSWSHTRDWASGSALCRLPLKTFRSLRVKAASHGTCTEPLRFDTAQQNACTSITSGVK